MARPHRLGIAVGSAVHLLLAASASGELAMEGGATATEGPARRIAEAAARAWPAPPLPDPPRPPGGVIVAPGASLQAALDGAAPGSALILEAGEYFGPIRIDRSLTLWGPREAVVRSNGIGHTVEVRGPGVRLSGFTVVGSGRRFELTDAAVHVRGDGCVVEGLRIREALFGISVEASRRVEVIGNEIRGIGGPDLGLRGDAVRFWEVRRSVIRGNRVTDGRDIVVWYSPDNAVEGNWFEFGRYGAHFMYSHRNRVYGNTFIGNLVGIFVMYSDSIDVIGNRLAFSDPTGGLGLGLKESGGVTVEDNILLRNQVGIYLDTSPLQRTHSNHFAGNRIWFCDAGVAFHRSETHNRFQANDWLGCSATVRVEGRGDALGVEWVGNYFDDYSGYDLDSDGVGDLPYEVSGLSDRLIGSRDDLRFLRGTPALALLDIAGRVFPMLQPPVLMRDPRPHMEPGREVADAD